MGDRLYDYLDFEMDSRHSIDDYNEDDEDMGGEYVDEEVIDIENEEKSDELACPFCSEDFDILGLCCHIDADHRMDVKPGICPFCATKVGINMASHVITQHESVLKALCTKKHRSARSRSAILLLRKDLMEKHLRRIKESPYVGTSSNAAADSTLLSFVNNPHQACKPQTNETACLTEMSLSVESSNDDSSESCRIQSPPSTDWHNERARRCEFLQGLLFSTMLDDL